MAYCLKKKREIARKDIIEQEIAQARAQREKQEEEWERQQEEILIEPGKPRDSGFVAPPSGPQKGPKGPAGKKKTKGTGEMIKSKK